MDNLKVFCLFALIFIIYFYHNNKECYYNNYKDEYYKQQEGYIYNKLANENTYNYVPYENVPYENQHVTYLTDDVENKSDSLYPTLMNTPYTPYNHTGINTMDRVVDFEETKLF